MISNHIYESTLRDLATLEEDQMIVDTRIDNFINTLQKQYNREEVTLLSSHVFNLMKTHGFEDSQEFINLTTLSCPKLIFPCHIFIDSGIGHWVTLVRILKNHKISFYYIDSLKNSMTSLNNIKEVLCNTPLFPSNQGVSWINIMNPPQKELECGSQVGLHMYLCCEGSTTEYL